MRPRGVFRRAAESQGTVPGGGPNLRFPGYDVVATVDALDVVEALHGYGGQR